ncbi:MAG: hypothetical protein Q9225_006972 [Loekoesia sp. 1 TL-2023]
METNELQQALETCTFELAYENCLHQYKITQEYEQARRLRVQLLLLEGTNDELHAQVAGLDDCILRVESDQETLKDESRQTEACLENAQAEIRIKAREIETLKAELSSLHGVTMDSTKLLTEKLALARELLSLRPEVDHLRSQAASNQSLRTEKLTLEHRIRALELELETEKKATQRILAGEGNARAEDADLKQLLETLRAELNRERRERYKFERENQQASSTWEAQKTALESRLDSLRNRLKTTKDTLKETQQELQNVRSTARPTTRPTTEERAASTYPKTAASHPRKRTASQMLSDSAIGTPGDTANERRNKRSSTLPGDKSAFPITPYLNRTASLAPESPGEATISALDATKTAEVPGSTQDGANSAAEDFGAPAVEKRLGDKASALVIAKDSKTNAKAVRGQDKLKTAAKLEKVAEEEHDENGEILESHSRTAGSTLEDQTVLGGAEAKRKKRKFLGGLSRTLFDEDDREATKPAPGARAFGSLSKGALAGPKSRPMLAASSASNNGFGAFSPLKRNIRPSVVGA